MATIQDIESAVMELEELFGDYVGEGDLVDEIYWIIDNLKQEREDRAQQTEKLSLESPLTPKGHVILARFGDDALLFRGESSPQPYVCAWGYDDKTGEWGHGTYYSDLGRAWDRIHPEIIEEASVRWQREDLRATLIDQGIEPFDKVVNDFLYEVNHLRGWRDNAIESGNEFLADKAFDLKRESLQIKPLQNVLQHVREISDMKESHNFDESNHNINER